MPKEKKKERIIAEYRKDNILVPTISLGRFVFGSDIRTYLDGASYIFEEDPDTKEDLSFNTFCFKTLNLEVWTDVNGIIDSVMCEKSCYWDDINLVGLRFEKFKAIFRLEPDSQDVCYLSNGHAHHVYEFNSVGLQIWVWYGIIRTVIAHQLYDD